MTLSSSGKNYIDSLVELTWNQDSGTPVLGEEVTLIYSYDHTQIGTISGVSSVTPFTGPTSTNEQTYVNQAMQAWANVAKITFAGSDVDPDIVFGKGSLTAGSGVEHSNQTGDIKNSSEVVIKNTFSTFIPNTSAYETLLHEIGHALGLKHPFSTPDSLGNYSPSPHFGDNEHDNTDATVMSYTTVTASAGGSSVYNITPMLYDIAAIQYLYGVNTTYKGENDSNHAYTGATAQKLTIWDGGGTGDTLNASGYADGATLDLRAGFDSSGTQYVSTIGKSVVFMAYGANIENATGGNGDDKIHGNDSNTVKDGVDSSYSGANVLTGGNGNDEFWGYGGDDTISGGDDADTIHYDYITSGGVSINLTSDNAGASEAGSDDEDSFTGIERIIGTDQVDTVKSLVSAPSKKTIVTAGHDSDGQYLKIDGPGSSTEGLKAYKFEKLVLGNGDNIVTLNLSEDSTLQEVSFGSPNSTGNNQINVIGGNPGSTGLTIYGGGGDDIFGMLPAGSTIHTGAGHDTIVVFDRVQITDASSDDRIYFAGSVLTGGIRAKISDSAYAQGAYSIKFAPNEDGELVIVNQFKDTLYLSNYSHFK